MVLSLLIVLSLLFTTGQVYRVNSANAQMQSVADASAIAAQSQVAEFMIVVRLCDALSLSLTLTSFTLTGLGVVALCVPPAASLSSGLLKASHDVAQARDDFARSAQSGLDRLQRAVPFISAVRAASVAAGNDSGGSRFMALALLVPASGDDIGVAADGSLEKAQSEVDKKSGEIAEGAEEAERLAQRATAAKRRAFEHDCGANPSYCLYERAQTLAGLSGADNPLFSSIDAWSFSVALDRAKAYYPARIAQEAPTGPSAEEGAQSALRMRFYQFAAEELSRGFVHESDVSFEAFFPRLPRNTEEMKETPLYTDRVYPVEERAEGAVMHAWPGCPGIQGATGIGSIEQMDQGGFERCPECRFSASSMGKVAAASSSIENGFEFHYGIIAEAARDYQDARSQLDPARQGVKNTVTDLLDQLRDAAKTAAGARIDARPPGRDGVIVLAANLGNEPVGGGFASPFVSDTGLLGARVALSAATLLSEPAGEGGTVVSSLLDGFKADAGAAVGAPGAVLECWSAMLRAYADGQDACTTAIERGLQGIPLVGESGLGTWAAGALRQAVSDVGLSPAKLDALKPVLVNTASVAKADSGPLGARLLSAKEQMSSGGGIGGLFSALVGDSPQQYESLSAGGVVVASIELFGKGGPSIPVKIAIPSSVAQIGSDVVQRIAHSLTGIWESAMEVAPWR